MNIMHQLIADNKRRIALLEKELAEAETVVAAVRKKLRHHVKHGKSLEADYGNGEATLPLAPPDEDDDEEEATDEPLDVEKLLEEAGPDPLVPDEWSPGYETPAEGQDADAMATNWDYESSAEEREVTAQLQAHTESTPAESEKPIRRRKAKAAAEEVSNG